ncbi:hypothetical protein J8C02_09945 [Chloracidobacterium sp. MS 40/45]|jgi:hypothetical protein|uniref:hypothetical protein n=1 Tax=Chloracidobacterium aggregatum TaxID=2851959 RepID=UPI001B8AA6AE|nr:hypothetical protein [Chloracidobacterium aggregatum]QUV99728.1 hypothetical protein J8C02_09945 [Chloracidobacterium sp. MS 40/45]
MSDRLVSQRPAGLPGTGPHASALETRHKPCRVEPAPDRQWSVVWGWFRERRRAFLAVCRLVILAGLSASFAGQPGTPPEVWPVKAAGRGLDDPSVAAPDVWPVVLLTLIASLSGLGLLALMFWVLLRTQRQQLEGEISALQMRLQRLESQPAPPTTSGTTGGTAPETALRADLTTLQSDLHSLREEVDYLKNKLSTLLALPETPPHPLPALSSGTDMAQVRPADTPPTPPPPPSDSFENQRVSDIIARHRNRLRAGHVDALTRHFSLNPSGLFLELEERGERLIFPAQEVIYGGDFQQNYSFVYDCDRPGSGYVVVVTPARLDARGQVVTRGRLRIE